MRKSLFIQLLAAPLIFLFLYTAVQKMLDPLTFKGTLYTIAVLRPIASLLTYGIPPVEILTAGLLCFPRFRFAGFVLASALLTLFSVYIALMLMLGSDLPCTCGGVLQSLTWKQHLLVNLVFLAAAGTGGILQRQAAAHPAKPTGNAPHIDGGV